MKYYVSIKVLVMFYYVHVVPVTDFCLNVWGHAMDSYMHWLEVLQSELVGLSLVLILIPAPD